MKKIAYISILLALAVAISACGKKKDSKHHAGDKGRHISAEAAAIPTGPAGPAKDANHQKLVGTHWTVGDFDVTVVDTGTMLIKGGPIAQSAPNGLKARYSYENGIIKVMAMGTAKTGTWDGEKLVVDGKDGVRQSQ